MILATPPSTPGVILQTNTVPVDTGEGLPGYQKLDNQEDIDV